jgi:hypothetical protein
MLFALLPLLLWVILWAVLFQLFYWRAWAVEVFENGCGIALGQSPLGVSARASGLGEI